MTAPSIESDFPRARSVAPWAIAGAILAFAIYLSLIAAGWWAVLNIVPDEIRLNVGGGSLFVGNIHNKIFGNASLLFLTLPLVLFIEAAVVGWQGSSTRQMLLDRTPSVKTDMIYMLLGQAKITDILGRVLTVGAAMISGGLVREAIRAKTGFAVDPGAVPLLAQVVLYFFVYTFFDYWTHRVDHSRYFWPLHRYHHAARDFVVINAGRSHPAAILTGTFIINMPLAVLGASPAVMVYVNVIVISIGFLIHSKIDSNWGWFGRYVIQSPNHHRLHHILCQKVPTGHFSMAPVWDHLFRTWRGEADQTLPIGVDKPYQHGWFVPRDIARDYIDFLRGWFKKSDTPSERKAG
jgi:sterol desaturase/sphingolipid hydroxylase (fatty acid hydroxylase superfamily)